MLTIYVPLTTQYRDSLYEVILPKLRFLDRDSIANVQWIGSIPTVRLESNLSLEHWRSSLDLKTEVLVR